MTRVIYSRMVLSISFFMAMFFLAAQQTSNMNKYLTQEYDLAGRHSKDTQYYEMTSRVQTHAIDGTPQGSDVYHSYLRCVPSADASAGDEYTCLKITFQLNKSPEVSVPSLAGWTYSFLTTVNGRDEKGQLFGIDQSKFEKLADENGRLIGVANTYYIYNSFIDFHSMSVFSERPIAGNGIQDLKHIGDKVVHAAAFSREAVNLGSQVGEGSYFKNGEVTLSFKGLAMKNKKVCSILEYDSRESSFYMVLKLAPGMEIPSKGSSHYWGDICKDISSGWIQEATLNEMVVTETTVPGSPNKMNAVIERSVEIENVTRPARQ
jgi:hypothetical protein